MKLVLTSKTLQTDTAAISRSIGGRDHWPEAFSALFAGAGIHGGQVIGAGDAQAAYPATRGWYPADLGATVYSAQGIDPGSHVYDRLGRGHRINGGQVITPLYS